MSSLPIVKVAAAHAAPVFLDRRATAEKAVSLIREAAGHGAELIVFPESYIPAFPVWAALWAPIHNHDLFEAMVEHSVDVPGPEVVAIANEARRLGVFVSIGISECSAVSVGCIWNSNLLIGDRGELLVHHRKLMPTFYEKLVWAHGDGAGLRVASTRLGRIGALICGENTNPLARYALMAQGEHLHISSWPPLWPTRPPRGGGNYDNVAANRLRVGAHCFEAKAFGVACAGFMDRRMRDFLVDRDVGVARIVDETPRAVSLFVDPTGATVGEWRQDEEGLVYAELDLDRCIEPKQFHDVVGYYNRFDVFDLTVTRERPRPASWVDRDPGTPVMLSDDPAA
ncbi:MAG: carbon-nitrogen hydrolase family protein [Burkholderiaceae bacterium]|jgi:aliphatic nitrilase|nr:carbon-nitrogen hydrolase family protein [Burkholderiales bacterium]MCZ8096493.1 carbon-nitrogen hydrolase family protein [Burkholderiales bacterium]MCZ8340751.1 carbon-nitrogen hydrolase family protein [Burkholderiaceae bacterium]